LGEKYAAPGESGAAAVNLHKPAEASCAALLAQERGRKKACSVGERGIDDH
jgi:hypothetical protein